MEAEFWLERWQNGEIGFHQAAGNDLLGRHWPSLGLVRGSTVLVPLCGKSVDMAWLAAQGHTVIGVELSPLAAADFFREHGLAAQVRREGAFTVHTAGSISIWCGDFFALPDSVTRDVAAVYDRAALVALPRDLKSRYAGKLRALLPAGTPILLVALTYREEEMDGPPFSTPPEQVQGLFAATHEIATVESRDGLASSPALRQRGVSQLIETVYLLGDLNKNSLMTDRPGARRMLSQERPRQSQMVRTAPIAAIR